MLISMGWPRLLCKPSMIPPCSGYPKIAYPVEMSSGSGIYSDAVSHLPAAQPPTAKRPADHVDVVYRDVIAASRKSRGHHYDAPFIYRILKSLFPQNNTFFIATASVVKDALDTTDCERLREQWYYLRFYVRRTMPPTDHTTVVMHHIHDVTKPLVTLLLHCDVTWSVVA